MIRLVCLFFSFYLATQNSFAGHEAGNGGDVVLCRNSKGEVASVELLDFYEARVQRKIYNEIDLFSDSHLEIAKKIIGRLTEHSPIRVKRYLAMIESFHSETLFLSGVQLVDIPDSENIILPNPSCSIEQIAIQRSPVFPEDKRYTINQDLWDLLDEENRAGLILHEIVYREAISYGHENSIAVRYFNSYMFSNKFKNMSQKNFSDFMITLKFKSSDMNSFEIDPESAVFFPSGRLKSAKTHFRKNAVLIHGLQAEIINKETISFFEGGSLESFKPALGSKFFNGVATVSVNSFCRIQLYENSTVKSLCISEPSQFLFKDNIVKVIEGGRMITLDEEGKVISIAPIVGT